MDPAQASSVSHPKHSNNNSCYFARFLRDLNLIVQVKCLQQYLHKESTQDVTAVPNTHKTSISALTAEYTFKFDHPIQPPLTSSYGN